MQSKHKVLEILVKFEFRKLPTPHTTTNIEPHTLTLTLTSQQSIEERQAKLKIQTFYTNYINLTFLKLFFDARQINFDRVGDGKVQSQRFSLTQDHQTKLFHFFSLSRDFSLSFL